MPIILSQRIDIQSDYADIPFSTYHFPKKYINQIHSGDIFVYYQGHRNKKEYRYYFGCGVIGVIRKDSTGENYFAEILQSKRFNQSVPIYMPDGNGFIESLGFEQVRLKPTPPWQNSIRKLSDLAYQKILSFAKVELDFGQQISKLEKNNDALSVLTELNTKYSKLPPKERARNVENYLDRGTAVTKALKSLLGAKCQICSWTGFSQKNGDEFIEAHHIIQLSDKKDGALCTDNIILVCPNCHREIHYGKDFKTSEYGDFIEINLAMKKVKIPKNTMEYLENKYK
jgi:hypothetical protein